MTGSRWLTDDEQRLWRQWLGATKGITMALGQQLQTESGLSSPDYEVLVVLSESDEPGVRITALADALGWERSRLSHHLTRMEKRGLVRRSSCPEDARGQRVELTEGGRERITEAAPGHVEAVRTQFLDPLDEADRAALARITSHIIEALPAGSPTI